MTVSPETLLYPSPAPPAAGALLLAHGAGAGQRHPFMTLFARAIAARGIDVATFDFPYITARRRVPDRAPVLEECYRAAIARVRDELPSAARALVIGGKSMGGRIATQVAAADPALPVRGIVLLGYPLHPPKRPEVRRDAHLGAVARPMLFVQGTRDPFATPGEIRDVVATLPAARLHLVDGGDHSFAVPRTHTPAQADVDATVRSVVAEWVQTIFSSTSPSAAKP